jgi:hypothetical protein
MTYNEIRKRLNQINQSSPEKMNEDAVFVAYEGDKVCTIACMEFNDGSITGVGKNSVFFSEV